MGYLQNCTGNWLSAPGPDLDMWRPQGLAFVWGPSAPQGNIVRSRPRKYYYQSAVNM